MKPPAAELKKIKEAASEWAKERLADPNTVIIDIESTGLLSQDPDTEIVQISIINVQGRPLFSMLLKPNKPMREEVIEIHKISNEQIQNQPIFPQVSKMIAFVLQNKHVVCYNADFDVKLLWHMFKKYEQQLPNITGSSCCMDRYSEWSGEWSTKKDGFKWQKLPALAYGMSHDALTDCQSTLRVMQKVAGEFNEDKLSASDIDLNF
jgi:DNA polymerase III epsilon subunit-like protein